MSDKLPPTLQLPHFEDIFSYLPEYQVELLYCLEHLFDEIGYTNHFDDINMLFNTYPFTSTSDRANLVMSVYREHIGLSLTMQGVFLSEPYLARLSDLLELVKACTAMGTKPLSELLAFEIIDTDLIISEFFAQIVSAVSELEVHQVLDLVRDISESTINYLHNNVPVPHLEVINLNHARDRFLKYSKSVQCSGLVIENIKRLNTFDYNPFSFYMSVREDLETLSEKELALELVLLLLGSHVPDEMLQKTSVELIDKFMNDLNLKMKIMGLVSKLLLEYGEIHE